MDLAEQLRVLQEAQDNPGKLALATVDLAYPALPDAERAALKTALEAAAIPHWCDEAILAALLEIPQQESSVQLDRLRKLKIIEPFPARGTNAVNVHEASRLALRKQMAADEPARFRILGTRAAAYFADNLTQAGRVEWMYHLLCGDPERGANELEKLERDWSRTARPEERYALAAALRELDDSRLVQGRTRVCVLLVTAWTRVSRGEASQLADMAGIILDLARSLADPSAEAEAQALLGDALEAQGKLAEAQSAFEKYLAISQRLAEQHPSNAGRQRDLAVAHSRVGGVFEAQGKLAEAQAAFEKYLAMSQRLAEQNPSNAGWERGLAVAHNRVGGVFEAQGKLAAAQTSFEKHLAMSQRLAEQDPSNAGWQRALAVAHNRVGGVLEAQGKLAEAQTAFEKDLEISQRLAEQDPSNAGWQRDLAAAHSRMGGVLEAQGKLAEAQTAFEKCLAICQGLAEQDLSNAGWQRALAVAHSRMGGVFKAQGKLAEAQAAFKKSKAITQRLT